jgi:hypothetical protein
MYKVVTSNFPLVRLCLTRGFSVQNSMYIEYEIFSKFEQKNKDHIVRETSQSL